MIVKTINDTINSDELMFILLIFETYSRMHAMNLSISSITQRIMIIEKAMIEIRKLRTKRQMIDALNARYDSIIISIHDIFLNSDVLVWRNNVNQRDKWSESFKLLNIESETCKIVLSSESTDFRSTVIKSFLIVSINDVESIDENVQSTSENVQSSDHLNNLSAESLEIIRSELFEIITKLFAITSSLAITRFIRTRHLSLRYQNLADITVFISDDDSLSNQFEDVLLSISIFMKSRRKEINDLLEKRVFELIIIDVVLRDVRIFNLRFVNEIKHSGKLNAYGKSRLVIQTYNDHDKTRILTSSFII